MASSATARIVLDHATIIIDLAPPKQLGSMKAPSQARRQDRAADDSRLESGRMTL